MKRETAVSMTGGGMRRACLAAGALAVALVLAGGTAFGRQAVFGAPATAADAGRDAPRQRAIHGLSSGPTGVTFDFTAGPLAPLSPQPRDVEPAPLVFEGATLSCIPGQPMVPVRTERILIPDGADYSVAFTVEGETGLSDLDLPVAPPPAVRTDATRAAEAVPRQDWPPPADQLYPESPVTTGVEVFRGRRMLLLTLAPIQYDPARRSARSYATIHVSVTFSRGAASARARLESAMPADPDFSAWRGLVLNPEVAAAERPPAAPAPLGSGGGTTRAPGIPPVYFGNAPTWVKVRIQHNGLYSVTGADLARAGVDLSSIDPGTLRVFSGPGYALNDTVNEAATPGWGERGGFQEVAIAVEESGPPNGRFDAPDSLLFYGLGVDNFKSWYDPSLPEEWFENPHTDTNVYWVTWGGSFPAPPLRIPVVDATPLNDDTPVSIVRDKLHAEVNDPALFDPTPRERGARWEKWWWQRIDDSGSSYFWDVPLPDVDASHPADVFIRWWGANTPKSVTEDPGQNHHLSVKVNDGAPVNVTWGRNPQDYLVESMTRKDMTVSGFTPRPTNRVIASVTRVGSDPYRVDQVLLAWMEFDYWKRLTLTQGTVWFSGSSALQPAAFHVEKVGTGAFVFDVTDPTRLTRLVPVSAGEGDARTLTFRVANPVGHRYFAVNRTAIRTPSSLEVDTRPDRWLRDTLNAADYIVVTYDDFLPAAQTLADWRRTHLRGITEFTPPGVAPRNARTVAIKASDVYDEFSGGQVDPTAIRNFVQYAYANWGTATPQLPRLAFLCLIGDANRDTRDYQSTGVRNLMPTWQDGYDPYTGVNEGTFQYSTDDFYGRIDGITDRFTDIVIGRLPVLSAGQAEQVVNDKIIHNESFVQVDPTRSRAILVADDVCHAGAIDGIGHTQQSESVELTIPGCFDRAKIYLYEYGGYDCSILYKPLAKRDLIRAMNEGSWLVNYIGHGGDQVIADEKVLEAADAPTITNLDALPVFIAASCSVGKFDRPSSEGLAEVLVKSGTGGALAAIAATHFSNSGENTLLNRTIFESLFPAGDNRSIPIGSALLMAKVFVTTITDCFGQVLDACDRQKKYILLGDPGSSIAGPFSQIRIVDAPDTLKRGGRVTIRGEVLRPDSTIASSYNGTVDLLVQDQPVPRRGFNDAGDTYGFPYQLPGATVFSGRGAVTNGQFEMTFVVPVSLRGGSAGRLRAYTSGAQGEAIGAIAPLPISGNAPSESDTTAPRITISLPTDRVVPGDPVRAVIEDESGINLTQIFEFRSLLFTVRDDADAERYRADVTGAFQYDEGSYTRGRVDVALPSLPAGHYTLRFTATDNYNNRGQGELKVTLGSAASEAPVSQLYALPNPFPDQTDLSYVLADAGSVSITIYSVSGRKVWEKAGISGTRGENRERWDGIDLRGDPVSNGVYLVRITTQPTAGGQSGEVVEPIVRVR